MSEADIDAVARPERWAATFDATEVAVLELATAMNGEPAPLDPAVIETLRAAFDEAQLAELLAVAGEASFNNRVSNAAKHLLRGD